jgi:ribonucleoside-diphosphate reductase alpha chain
MECKGVAVYCYRGREVQVLNIVNKKDGLQSTKEAKPKVCPNRTAGFTFLMRTECGKMYVTVNEDDDSACEVFTQPGKPRAYTSSQTRSYKSFIFFGIEAWC